MKAAIFSDVEGTLVDGSLPAMFLQTGKRLKAYSFVQSVPIGFLALVSKVLPAKLRRQSQLISLLISVSGHTRGQVDKVIEATIPDIVAALKPSVMARVTSLREDGLPLVLVSGGMHEAIIRLGLELEARGEGTKIKMQDGKYRIGLDGGVCQGQGKADRASAVLREMGYDPAQSYAFGDTASDIPFLSLFGHPCAVDPDPVLEAEAKQRGWAILRTM